MIKQTVLFILFLFVFRFAFAEQSIDKIVLDCDDFALTVLPQDYDRSASYPLMIALHGISENAQTSVKRWSGLSKENGYILLAPQGTGTRNSYVSDVTGNIHNIFKYIKIIKQKHKLISDDVLVAGFSMGGNFAIDMALRHPHRFPKALCVFGFFGERHAYWAGLQNPEYIGNQKYYLITGEKDVTRDYLRRADRVIRYRGGQVKLDIYKDLYHSLPADIVDKFREIEAFFYRDEYEGISPDICLN